MGTGFGIRVANLDDVPRLTELIEASVRVLQQEHYTAAQMDGALGHALGVDTQLIRDGTYFVAFPADHPGTVAGCGGWSYRRTLFGSDHGPHRGTDLLDPSKDAAKIRAIFVHPDWARQGLGSFILETCEAAAVEAGFCRFEMGSTLTGVALYTLRVYQAVEKINVPLPNGEAVEVVHMVKNARE